MVLPMSSITWGCKHVEFFMKISIKKDSVYVHLMKGPIEDRCNSEKATDCDKLSNMSKCLSVIDAFTLGEPFGDQVSFVALDGTIILVFNFENSFATHRTIVSW